MKIQSLTLNLNTSQPIEIIDISRQVKNFVENSSIKNGFLSINSMHTTMAVIVNEWCEHLREDILSFFGKLAPAHEDYQHNRHSLDGRPNAHSHLLSALLSSHQGLVVAEGRLLLGEWQSIFAIELDGSRPLRKVVLTLLGE